MTVQELIELKGLITSWELKDAEERNGRCERCWTEAQLSSHNYESTTEAYYAAMMRAEAREDPCTQPSPRRTCAMELEAWIKTNESARWNAAGRELLAAELEGK